MQIIENLTLKDFDCRDYPKPLELNNLQIKNCITEGCFLGLLDYPENLPRIKNIEILNCKSYELHYYPLIAEKVLIENFSFGEYGIMWSPFFKHVTLRGKISSFRINSAYSSMHVDEKIKQQLIAFHKQWYQDVDWGLDISEAKLSSFDYTYEHIPAKFFKRDPDTQFLVKKEKFYSMDLLDDKYKQSYDYVTMYLENLVKSDSTVEDMVITTPLAKPKKRWQPILEGLQELRRLGFAEKD